MSEDRHHAPVRITGDRAGYPQPRAYKNYRWIAADLDLLGGKPAIRGTRLSVALILECLSVGMDLADILP